ncbi:FCD domain-containing protein [Pseudoroseomonas globiformis]|uniref:FCD domain-containing protein n=1 Tax=Teichococcus globiformis TaxID=2307229 RepID=A0ABV7G1G2_9PROT
MRLASSLDPHHFLSNPNWKACHLHLHQAILAACGAPELLAFCDKLRDEAGRYRALASTRAYSDRDVALEHAEIARAPIARDAERTRGLHSQHYERTVRLLGAEMDRGL